jgi:hypothetical protein
VPLGQVDGAGVDGSLPTALAEAVRQAALAEYEAALSAVFSAGAEVSPTSSTTCQTIAP